MLQRVWLLKVAAEPNKAVEPTPASVRQPGEWQTDVALRSAQLQEVPMSLRWVDDNTPVLVLPRQRQKFYRQIEQTLRAHDPGAQARIEAELQTWLDDVSGGRADYASIERNVGADWNGFERQSI